MIDHRKMFSLCVEQALFRSDDPVTRNGAVLVGAHGHRIAEGANRFVRRPLPGWIDRVRTDRDFKYAVMQHAETDCILSALRDRHFTGDCELYCLFAACPACARLIVRAGVKVVHTLTDAALGGIPARWRKDVDAGRKVLFDCDVQLQFHEDLALGEGFLFDGRLVYV